MQASVEFLLVLDVSIATITSRPAKPRHTVVLVRAAEEEGTKLVGSVTQSLPLGGCALTRRNPTSGGLPVSEPCEITAVPRLPQALVGKSSPADQAASTVAKRATGHFVDFQAEPILVMSH